MGESSACLVRSFPHVKSPAFTRDRDVGGVKTGSVSERKAYYDSFSWKRSAVDDSDKWNLGSLNEKKSKISSFSTTKGGNYTCAPPVKQTIPSQILKNSEAKTPTFETNENVSPNIQGDSCLLQLVLSSSLSFGRWHLVKWSAFTRDREMEEVKRYCKLGLVAEMKAYFEAHFKKQGVADLLEQQNASPNIQGNSSAPHWTSTQSLGTCHCVIWSAFTRDRHMEEVNKYCKPGSVAEKKAYFEAQFKKRRAAALLEQQNAVAKGDDIISKKEVNTFNEDDFDKRESASLNENSVENSEAKSRLKATSLTLDTLKLKWHAYESATYRGAPVSIILLCQIFFLLLIVFAISDSIWYQSYYCISAARQVARMVPTQHAPILHHFSGESIIRSFYQEDGFSVNLVDDYPRVFNLVFFLLLVIILVSLPRLDIEPRLTSWVIWNFCNVENKTIPSEAALLSEDYRPHLEWSLHRRGRVDIENDHVLQNENEI